MHPSKPHPPLSTCPFTPSLIGAVVVTTVIASAHSRRRRTNLQALGDNGQGALITVTKRPPHALRTNRPHIGIQDVDLARLTALSIVAALRSIVLGNTPRFRVRLWGKQLVGWQACLYKLILPPPSAWRSRPGETPLVGCRTRPSLSPVRKAEATSTIKNLSCAFLQKTGLV